MELVNNNPGSRRKHTKKVGALKNKVGSQTGAFES